MGINVTRPFLAPKEEYDQLIQEIWNTNWLTNNGPLLREFEENLKSYLNLDRLHLTVNGHIALETAIRAFDLQGEVITTPFTFASTTHAIVRQGLTPVFCDIRPDDYTIDPAQIESLISDKTCAIVPVHVYGYPCAVDTIQNIANKYGLKVIYDAAHTFGVRLKGKSLCSYGDSSILSFHATKLFHSIEGGAVISHDDEYSQKIEEGKNYGIIDEETVASSGGNAKMNEFQAAMGILNLRYIDTIVEERRQLTEHYHKLLDTIPGISYYCPDPSIVEYNYAYMPVVVDEQVCGCSRNELYLRLKEKEINARKYFYPITNEFQCYKNLYAHNTPVAKRISESILCLPLYNGLSFSEIDNICTIISDCSKK